MREMKESGISWIGKIPEGWRVEKLKYHLVRNEPRNPGNQQILSVYRKYGVIPKDGRDDNHNVTSEDTSKYKYVKKGVLVINKMKAWQGALGVSEFEGVVSPAYFIYKFIDELLFPGYIHYLLRNCYKTEFRRISGGIREGQWDLSPTAFENTLILIPNYKEQKAISDYLDDKCAELDALQQDIEKEIETLKAYKKSLITQAVTKGLDSHVEMKDSGVEWIGKIPKHWEVYKVKYATSLIGSGTTPKSYILEYYDGDIPWIQSGDLYRREYITSTLTTVTEKALRDNSTLTLYEPPYLVIAMYGASIGNCAISNIRACVNQACCVLKINSQNSLHFLKYWFILSQDNFIQKAVGGGQPNISQIKIKQHFFVKVPIKEQNKIVKFLDSKCSEIDAIIASKQKQLEVLSDYKKSLIYEVVTGKKEVPLHE